MHSNETVDSLPNPKSSTFSEIFSISLSVGVLNFSFISLDIIVADLRLPKGGGDGGYLARFFDKNCVKMKEIGPRGRGRP